MPTSHTTLELADVADLIDAIDAAADGDFGPGANLAGRLTPTQGRNAVLLLIGMCGGTLDITAAASGLTRAEAIARIRRNAAEVL